MFVATLASALSVFADAEETAIAAVASGGAMRASFCRRPIRRARRLPISIEAEPRSDGPARRRRTMALEFAFGSSARFSTPLDHRNVRTAQSVFGRSGEMKANRSF
jgi:hypothetical protein